MTALPLVFAAGLVACTDEPEPAAPAAVRIAIEEPVALVPTDVDEADGAQVLSALFAPLVAAGEQGQRYELAAESVEPDQEGRVWTIRLRDGFTFHNGEPVTVDSYLAAWNYGAYQQNQQRNSYLFRRIEGHELLNAGGTEALSGLAKVDERTFTVTLTEPFGEFGAMLGAPAFYPLPAAAFGPDGALRPEFADAPVGNGPFQMVGTWERGARIELARYRDYPGDPVRVDGIEFVVYPDSADPYPDLLAGELDVVTRIPTGHLATVESDLGDRYLRHPASAYQFLAFPAYQPELADPEIRRAISMAIDRDDIATGIFRGTQTPARSFVPPTLPGARADSCGEACRLDPAAARALYQQSGGPAELTITYNADGDHHDWVAATCDQLRAHLGVACSQAPEPTLPDLLTKLDGQEPVGIVRLGWVMDYPSIESYLAPVYSTDGSANVYGYSNPEFDALVTAGAYQQAEAILASDLPVVPLGFGQHTIGHSPRVSGVTVTGFGHLDLTTLELTD
jgi:peptide/nickel transport system substrate-binding protein/oligopeptide transport system substrate-binding protein